MPDASDQCPGCGWLVPGGGTACREKFDRLLARDFSDARYFASHRLFVDTYCLQRPDDFCRSAKSLAAHLVGLCWIVENQASAATGAQQLRDWLDGPRDLPKPDLPDARGAITLGDMDEALDPAQWASAVQVWAASTWEAYRALHPLARQWLAEAMSHVHQGR